MTENWLDINEIADYLDQQFGKNNLSNSTLRRWINTEAKNSPNVGAVKQFDTSALGSKKPVTKYNIKLVNQMLEHNLNRLQKHVEHLDPAAVDKITDNERDDLTKELANIKEVLLKQQQYIKELNETAQLQYKAQLWLEVSRLQLLVERAGDGFDAKGLYQDLLNDNFHDDIDKYRKQLPTDHKYAQLDALQQNHNLNQAYQLDSRDNKENTDD